MFITGKHLSRRHVLRGIGTSIALPLLGAMMPAARAQEAAKLRLGFIYVPHGAVQDPALHTAGAADRWGSADGRRNPPAG